MREIIKEPNSLLHQKCEPVSDFEEAKQIADDLLATIKSVNKKWKICFGFAANQIGYSKRVIVLKAMKNEYKVLINPVLIEKKFPFPWIESCFSFSSRKLYLVKRYLWAKVRYQDLEGNLHETVLKGISAVYQEIDHIDGIMVSDAGLRIF